MASIARVELETFSEFQKDLHAGREDGEVLESYNHTEHIKTTWHAHLPCRFGSSQNRDTIVYKPPGNFDTLLYSYRVHYMPAIRVKEEYKDRIRICWPHNLGINLCTAAKALFNEEPFQTIDSKSNDCAHQFFSMGDKESAVNEDMGNVPEMENWNTILPKYKVVVYDPWNYSRDPTMSIPLYLCNLCPFTHEYKFCQKVGDLLKIQEKIDNGVESVWKHIPFNVKYVDISTETDVLPTPELWGRFDVLDDELRRYFLNFWNDENNKIIPGKEYVMWIDDFFSASSENPQKMGQNISVSMESVKPVKAFFWMLENVNAAKTKNLSNYTTNLDSVYTGRTPWGHYNYKYSASDRLLKMDPVHASRAEPRSHALMVPRDKGYGMYSYSLKPRSLHPDVGVVLTSKEMSMKAQLCMAIEDDDPFDCFRDEDDPKPENIDQYQLHVRMLVTRKVSFSYIEGSNPFGFKVTIN